MVTSGTNVDKLGDNAIINALTDASFPDAGLYDKVISYEQHNESRVNADYLVRSTNLTVNGGHLRTFEPLLNTAEMGSIGHEC